MTRRISNHFFISVNGLLWFQIWKWSLECWPKQTVLCKKTVYRFLKENGPQILQIWKCHPREEKVWITASYLCPLQNSLSLIIFIPLPLGDDEIFKSSLYWSPSKWRMNVSKCPFKTYKSTIVIGLTKILLPFLV